jgi:hypothetical protein
MLVIHVNGAAELRRVAALIRAEGTGPQVARDITELTHAGGPRIRAAFKAHATAVLPSSGGLNAWVASSRVTFTRKRGALVGGMRVNVGRNTRWGSQVRAELEGINAGLVIHPGNRFGPGWYGQSVRPNAIEQPITTAGGRVLQGAVESAAERLVARIG